MWCRQCRQDVPGSPAGEEGKVACPRCAAALQPDLPLGTSDHRADGDRTDPQGVEERPLPPLDDWEQDEQLRQIGRTLGSGSAAKRRQSAYQRELARLDPPHGTLPMRHSGVAVPAKRRLENRPRAGTALPLLTWAALSLGVMAFACGGVLLGWSLATGRQELWSLGLPIALGGQIALLLGLILQLDRLWHDGRHAADKLDTVDQKLRDLQTTTTLLGTGHGSPAAFYAHLAEGANPSLLLTDLKSQLDLLALKLSNEG